MALHGALTLALAIAAGSPGDRLLLCRARVAGDAALARPEALLEAARRNGRFLDYGVPCDDAAESARAARRAGLAHAVSATSEGRVEGSRYVLVLSDAADEARRAERTVEVAPGADAVRPLRSALSQLVGTLPPRPGPSRAHVAAWGVAGAGVVAVVAGTIMARQARSAAGEANSAPDLGAWVRARNDWRNKRAWSGVLLGTGTAAVAAGLIWRFEF